MEIDYAVSFASYREYVALCIEANEYVPTFSEFLGRPDNPVAE